MTDAQTTPSVDTLWARLVATLCPLLPEAKDELFLAAIHNDLNDLERELTDHTTALADARRALEEARAYHDDYQARMESNLTLAGKERDQLRADLAAARAEWQDIATAPKDGKRVLLWCPAEGEGCEEQIGYWSTCTWVYPGAWIIYESRSDTVELAPTHWRPLSTAP